MATRNTVTENAPEGYVPVQFTVAVDATTGELTVTQVKCNGYESKDAVTVDDAVVTNYLEQQQLNLFGEKKWVGGITNSAITLELFRDGQTTNVTTKTAIDWTYSFNDLERFNLETGKAYEYTVKRSNCCRRL